MRRTPVWLMTAAIALAFAGPAFAADLTGAGSSTPVKATRTHHLMGQVVSVDPAAESVIVKHATSKIVRDTTFTAEPDAVGALAGLKPGDQVKVTHVTDRGNFITTRITKNAHMAKKCSPASGSGPRRESGPDPELLERRVEG